MCVHKERGLRKKIPPVGVWVWNSTKQTASNWYVLVRTSSHKVIFCWLMSEILQVRNGKSEC